ncbi:MAG: hypothetical protein OXC63_03955 [Aestuariivita sp.]|nr:hypothetical protein [Aestuariivita sp.]MCY4347016.1 hypothetical protein [Aestuariivita sp.]
MFRYIITAMVTTIVGASFALVGKKYIIDDPKRREEADQKKENERERHEWREMQKNLRSLDFQRKDKSTFTDQKHDTPCLEITSAKVSDPGRMKWEAATGEMGQKSQISQLNPLLSSVPNLGIGTEVLTENYAKVSLPQNYSWDDLATVAGEETSKRGMIKVNGKITEHAKLDKPNQLRILVSVAGVHKLLAMLVAEKQLYDINEKLGRIDKKLDEIKRDTEEVKEFQKDERRSKLEGAFCNFRDIIEDMANHQFSDIHRSTVSSILSDLENKKVHIEKDISATLLKLKDIAGLGSEFNKAVDSLLMFLKEHTFCQYTRLCGYRIMLFVEENPEWIYSRVNNVRKELEDMYVMYREVCSIIIEILAKDKFSKNSLSYLADIRDKRELENDELLIEQVITIAHELVNAQNSPVNILLKLDDEGKIQNFAFAEE